MTRHGAPRDVYMKFEYFLFGWVFLQSRIEPLHDPLRHWPRWQWRFIKVVCVEGWPDGLPGL